jgi:hypothetical protein
MSKRFDNSPTQEHVSVPERSRRLFGWSQTILQQTKFARASVYAQRWCLQLPRPRFRTADNEGNLDPSSMVRLSRRTEHIQTHPASGNAQDSDGMPVHRQTIPEIAEMCAGSPLPLPDADGHSYHNILYVEGTCVKWIPPLKKKEKMDN